MAKAQSISGKVRFIMLEADIVDGNLSEIAQAISGAIRPAPVVQRAIAPPQAAVVLDRGVEERSASTDPPNLFTHEELVEEPLAQVNSKKPGKPRKFPEPKVLDVDLDSGDMPWEKFAKLKNPADTTKKFLTVAAWFKEHRDTPSITLHHVYTCYKKIGWGTAIKDFGAPFRDLKAQDWVGSSKPGTFEINHIGLDVIRKMGTTE